MPPIQKYLLYFQYLEAWPFEHTIDDHHDGDDNTKGFIENWDCRQCYHAFSNFHNLESHFPLQIWVSLVWKKHAYSTFHISSSKRTQNWFNVWKTILFSGLFGQQQKKDKPRITHVLSFTHEKWIKIFIPFPFYTYQNFSNVIRAKQSTVIMHFSFRMMWIFHKPQIIWFSTFMV